MKEIRLTIKPDGEIHIETRGFSGASCIEEAAFLKKALGAELARSLTPAFFDQRDGVVTKKHLPLCG